MFVHVAFTPAEVAAAPVGVVVDVIRATSTITQALAAGYERVLCCREVAEAVALRTDDSVTAGERRGVKVPELDYGVSPQDYTVARARTLVLSTTNGTTAIVEAASHCDTVLLGSLLNLDALVRELRETGEDVAILCAGFQGAFALDDAYCAGRIVQGLDATRSDAAIAAEHVARAYPDAWTGLNARTYGPPGLEDDIRFCAQESVLDVVPRFAGMVGPAAEVTL